jgi:hypothetical protein
MNKGNKRKSESIDNSLPKKFQRREHRPVTLEQSANPNAGVSEGAPKLGSRRLLVQTLFKSVSINGGSAVVDADELLSALQKAPVVRPSGRRFVTHDELQAIVASMSPSRERQPKPGKGDGQDRGTGTGDNPRRIVFNDEVEAE